MLNFINLSSSSFVLISFLSFSSTLSATYAAEQTSFETAPLSASGIQRVTVLENESPNFIKATKKVKRILENMQARKKDYISVTEAFIKKFSDSNMNIDKKIEVIDPIWFELSQKKSSNYSSTREKLQHQLNHRKATLCVAKEDFEKRLMIAKNGFEGCQALIDVCDDYICHQNSQTLTTLLDSLLSSHLLSLDGTLKAYIPHETVSALYSHISLKEEEINAYYTQDSRLDSLNQIYYISDFIRPIHILIKEGLQPDARDWGFCESLQKYIHGKLTLDEPTDFLVDGFLYQKGMEKIKGSKGLTDGLAKLSGMVNFGGIISGDSIKVESLSLDEKMAAIKKYGELYQAHRKRVKDYIDKEKNHGNIAKSREFLETILKETSEYSTVPLITMAQPEEEKHTFSQQKKRNQKRPSKKTQQENTASKEVNQKLSTMTPKREIASIATSTTSTTTTTSTNQIATPLNIDAESTSLLTKEASQEKLLEQKDVLLPNVNITTPSVAGSLKIKQPSENTTSSTQLPLVKKEKKENTRNNLINTTSRKILLNILEATTSPFTINYVQALNAMDKIDIRECPSTRKGDYRKLVRMDSNGNIIGKIFAYSPATSTLGYELMKIYRTFIEAQLNDRQDLRARIYG